MKYLILVLFICNIANAESKQKIESLIFVHSIAQGVNPNLALAIAKTESRLNPKALGSKGEIGIFQLRPEFHKGNLWNVERNIITGIKYLKQMETKCYKRYGEAWFICFNTGAHRKYVVKQPKKFPYYVKVQKRLSFIVSND